MKRVFKTLTCCHFALRIYLENGVLWKIFGLHDDKSLEYFKHGCMSIQMLFSHCPSSCVSLEKNVQSNKYKNRNAIMMTTGIGFHILPGQNSDDVTIFIQGILGLLFRQNWYLH